MNLPTLASSNGASTSSKIQNGAGLIKYIANNIAVAVKVRSPPLNCVIEDGRLPLGLATISTAVSARLVGSTKIKSQESSSVNNALKSIEVRKQANSLSGQAEAFDRGEIDQHGNRTELGKQKDAEQLAKSHNEAEVKLLAVHAEQTAAVAAAT